MRHAMHNIDISEKNVRQSNKFQEEKSKRERERDRSFDKELHASF
jgi:hypothetical protein